MNEKKRIILRVKRKLQEQNKTSPTNYLTNASYFTGLHPNTLKQLEKSEEITVNLDNVNRTLIYDTIRRFYVRYRPDGGKLPTTYELLDALNKMDKLLHMNIESFRKMLLKMDFIWKKVDGNNCVVIEKPLVRFERYNYLTQIRRSRVDRYDHIYFVDEIAYNHDLLMHISESRELEKFSVWQQKVIYAVGVKTVSCLKDIDDFNENVFEDWILTDLCPSLSKPSVIVVKDLKHHNTKLLETPTLYSPKLEIMDWLDHHNVIYETEMSKYELYSLAEEFTELETPLYKIDGILKARGHTLLRLPKCVEGLNPAELFFKLVENNWSLENRHLATIKARKNLKVAKSCFLDIILNAAKLLAGYTISVIGDELKMIAVEKDVDFKLDRLMMESVRSAVHMEIYDSDVASCSDSD